MKYFFTKRTINVILEQIKTENNTYPIVLDLQNAIREHILNQTAVVDLKKSFSKIKQYLKCEERLQEDDVKIKFM